VNELCPRDPLPDDEDPAHRGGGSPLNEEASHRFPSSAGDVVEAPLHASTRRIPLCSGREAKGKPLGGIPLWGGSSSRSKPETLSKEAPQLNLITMALLLY